VKRFLLIGTMLLGAVPQVQAQWAVIDNANLTQMIRQVQQAAEQIQLLQQQVQTVMSVYNAISHVTDLGSAVSALGLLGIQNPLPVNPYAVQNLLSGRGSITGMSASIGSLFNSNLSSSHVYTPNGSSYQEGLLSRNATSIAGMQGLAGQLYQSMSQRLPLLAELQARLETATTQKDVDDLQARLLAEQSYIQAQGVQAQSLAMMQVSAYQSRQQEHDEQRQQELDSIIAANPDQ
jgi:type IV secretion system protein VirB5